MSENDSTGEQSRKEDALRFYLERTLTQLCSAQTELVYGTSTDSMRSATVTATTTTLASILLISQGMLTELSRRLDALEVTSPPESD